jgi:hypothetical protein
MKKNVIWWPALTNPDHLKKYGGFEYYEYSRKSWEYWCKKNNCIFVPFTNPIENDFTQYRPQWQKCLYVFDELDRLGIEFDQIALIDSSAIVKWNCPNFFEITDRKFVGWRDNDNLKWVYESIQGYKSLFDDYELDISKYINSGFMIFNESHRDFFKDLKHLYLNKKNKFIELQDGKVRKGNDQTPINYLLQINNIDIKLDLPILYNLRHMDRNELFGFNWQLNEDETPFYIKYGYVWRFTGIPKDKRTEFMKNTWDMIKHNYEENPTIEFLLESINEDKHENPTTTSNKFKTDIYNFFKDFKDKICIEFGTHKGQTTKVLSYCFKKVYTINISDDSLANAKMLNVGIENIKYKSFDLYSTKTLDIDGASVFMVDAGHKYNHVISDINRCISMSSGNSCYIIFDDYGLDIHVDDVKKAVDECIYNNKIELVKKIGFQSGDTLRGNIFEDAEGLICRIVR